MVSIFPDAVKVRSHGIRWDCLLPIETRQVRCQEASGRDGALPHRLGPA